MNTGSVPFQSLARNVALSAVGNSTKADAAYFELRRGILTGSLLPGHLLEQETLAAQLELSTTPVREALRHLEAEGLVESIAFRKVRVSRLSKRELRELYEIRLSLDPLAASLAATNASTDEIEQSRKALVFGEHDPLKRLEVNRAFHHSIYSASNSTSLTAMLDSLWDRTDRYRYVLARRGVDLSISVVHADQSHQAMWDALANREPETLAKLMHDHITESVDRMEQLTADLDALSDVAVP